MAVSEAPWSTVSESDYPTASDFCRAALIDLNPAGGQKTKGACHLPVKMPNGGPVNRNGAHAAAVVLAGGRGGVNIPPAAKRAAARSLVSIYRNDLNEDPPESLQRLAR